MITGLPTYYEMNRDEIMDLSWEDAFIKLVEEVLDCHFMDAADLATVYLESKGFSILGETVIRPGQAECESCGDYVDASTLKKDEDNDNICLECQAEQVSAAKITEEEAG